MEKKFIEIRRKPNKTNLPDHLYEDSTRSIGATLGSAGNVVSGLSVHETVTLMPHIIGISSSSPEFYRAVEDYFASLTIKVESGGKRLDITLDADQSPVNVQDYIFYLFAKANPKVAESNDKLGASHQFYFYDPFIETQKKFVALQSKKDAEKEFIKITADDKRMKLVLSIVDPFALSLSKEEKELRLDAFKTANPDKFLAIATDPELETKAFIESCLTSQVLRRVGTSILNGDQTLGNTLEEAVLFLKDQKNSEVLATLKARMRTFK